MLVTVNGIDNVFGSVWLATAILSYKKYLLSDNKQLNYTDFSFKQVEIQALASQICSKEVNAARISQWCNGDHENNNYNYLRKVGNARRLTVPGEFNGEKEMPENLLTPNQVVFEIPLHNKSVTYEELVNWIVKDFKKLYLNENTKQIKMQWKEKELLFQEVKLNFVNIDQQNIFTRKNNKTLLETINHEKYKKLEETITKLYYEYRNDKLGDFLNTLKIKGDSFYLRFLNKYGDLRYCTFFINDERFLSKKGLYAYFVGKELKYIGRCRDTFKKRINQGYGKISAKNCYIDGQSTNCHLNHLINENKNNIRFYVCEIEDTNEIESAEIDLIKDKKPEWNISLKNQ